MCRIAALYFEFSFRKSKKNKTFIHSLHSKCFALSAIRDEEKPGGCLLEQGARHVGKNTWSTWDELFFYISNKTSFRIERRCENRVQIKHWLIYPREGIKTLRALCVGSNYPPCCFSARSCSEVQWAEHGVAILWLGVRLPLWLHKSKLHVCTALKHQ